MVTAKICGCYSYCQDPRRREHLFPSPGQTTAGSNGSPWLSICVWMGAELTRPMSSHLEHKMRVQDTEADAVAYLHHPSGPNPLHILPSSAHHPPFSHLPHPQKFQHHYLWQQHGIFFVALKVNCWLSLAQCSHYLFVVPDTKTLLKDICKTQRWCWVLAPDLE